VTEKGFFFSGHNLDDLPAQWTSTMASPAHVTQHKLKRIKWELSI